MMCKKKNFDIESFFIFQTPYFCTVEKDIQKREWFFKKIYTPGGGGFRDI